MRLDPLRVLGLAIPSFCIFYTFSWAKLPPLRPFHETFANHDLYLDLYYATNPDGYFIRDRQVQRVGFRGYLVTDDAEEVVTGYRLKTGKKALYVFDSRRGTFKGTLESRADVSTCEPRLRFQFAALGIPSSRGVLNGAFCP